MGLSSATKRMSRLKSIPIMKYVIRISHAGKVQNIKCLCVCFCVRVCVVCACVCVPVCVCLFDPLNSQFFSVSFTLRCRRGSTISRAFRSLVGGHSGCGFLTNPTIRAYIPPISLIFFHVLAAQRFTGTHVNYWPRAPIPFLAATGNLGGWCLQQPKKS